MAHDPCASFREDIPAYALGALDTVEALALESHLRACDACLTELAAYRAIGDALLLAPAPQLPPVALRGRLQRRLPDAHPRRSSSVRFSWMQLVLGAAVVMLIVLNLFSLAQLQALQRQQAQIAQQAETQQAVLAILAYPNIQSFPIWQDGVSGRLLVDNHHNVAALILWNLPPLPENQTYQIWLADAQGDRTSAGLFRPEDGQALTSEVFFTQQDLSDFTGLGVTVEPAGGSTLPTGARIFKVDF